MADPDLELRGLDLLALSAIFPSVISSFYTQNKGGRGGGAGPSPRSATATDEHKKFPLDIPLLDQEIKEMYYFGVHVKLCLKPTTAEKETRITGSG